jgi:two-component system phosphate regulon sensor histidine kinase PhoR
MLAQRKLSLIKSDFINNMTHELKTPLATVSLAVDAVRNEKVQRDPEKLLYFSGIIKEESKRMNKHVETILQAGLMERQDLKMNMVNLHVHDVITKVVDGFKLQLQDKGGKIELLLNAANDLIFADETHFTNMVNNLVDNAVKYSKEHLLIQITTHSTTKNLVIRFADNGIGMSKETVKRIFEKFYRAHTGNIHNVKGFGLGMSYVKTVVDVIKGKIKVESTLGKGSTFIVEIPLSRQ